MSRPSPMARPLQVTDLHAWRDRHPLAAKRQAVAAGHPCAAPYDHEREHSDMRCVFVTPLEASLIVQALRGRDGLVWHELADAIDGQVRRSDDCNPHGMVRP